MADHDTINRAEVWKPIPGFEEYEASEFGHIRRVRDGRIVGQSLTSYGYYEVTLPGKKRARSSVFICLAFHGPRPTPLHYACHNNGNKRDNRSCNLRWGTQQENIRDKYLHGTMGFGEKNPFAKLGPDDVREIRRLCSAGARQQDVAEQFGVCQVNVSAIVRRKTWGHIE